jgi:hypothetical protein
MNLGPTLTYLHTYVHTDTVYSLFLKMEATQSSKAHTVASEKMIVTTENTSNPTFTLVILALAYTHLEMLMCMFSC